MHSLNALGLIICTTGFFFTFCWFCNINGPQEILSSSDGASSKKNLFSSYPLCMDILLASMHSRHLTPASSPIGCRLTQIGIEFLPTTLFTPQPLRWKEQSCFPFSSNKPRKSGRAKTEAALNNGKRCLLPWIVFGVKPYTNRHHVRERLLCIVKKYYD